jgi:hypothetical protein
MMDLLLQNKMTNNEVRHLIAKVFKTEDERILVMEQQAFNQAGDLDLSSIDCLCVAEPVLGDAEILIHLYRYTINNRKLFDRILEVCAEFRLGCYLPSGNFDDWIYAAKDGSTKLVKHIDRDDRFEFV